MNIASTLRSVPKSPKPISHPVTGNESYFMQHKGEQSVRFEVNPETLEYEVDKDSVAIPLEFGKRSIKKSAEKFLIPRNYPHSVSSDYGESRKWSFLRNIATGTLGYLGTSAALNSMQFGAVGPVTTGMAWMFRTGLANTGSFLGASWAHRADEDPKGWMLKGGALSNLGNLTETALVLAPQTFLVTAPLASFTRALGGAFSGAAGNNILDKQAIDDNQGEVASKNGNQVVLANLLGSVIGMGIEACASIVGPAAIPVAAGAAFLASVYSRGKQVASLDLPTLNRNAIKTLAARWHDYKNLVGPQRDDVLGIIRQQTHSLFQTDEMDLGVSLTSFLESPERVGQLRNVFSQEKYLLDWDGKKKRILLHKDVTQADIIRSVFQASTLDKIAESPEYKQHLQVHGKDPATLWAIRESLRIIPSTEDLTSGLQAVGWDVENTRISAGSERASWGDRGL